MRMFNRADFTPAPSALGPMTPHAYLALRRTAAGLGQKRLATMLVLHGSKAYRRLTRRQLRREAALAWVELIERPGTRIIDRDHLELLATVSPIDPDVYVQLATQPVDRHPTLCRSCGVAHDVVPVHDGQCRACATGRATNAGAGRQRGVVDGAEAA